MKNYRIGKYRIRKDSGGYVIEKRRGLFSWYEVGFQFSLQQAIKIVEKIQKNKED